MTLFLISLLVMGLVIAAMAIGVIAGRAPIKGSCGGISSLGAPGVSAGCDICGGNPQHCDAKTRDQKAGKNNPTLYSPAEK